MEVRGGTEVIQYVTYVSYVSYQSVILFVVSLQSRSWYRPVRLCCTYDTYVRTYDQVIRKYVRVRTYGTVPSGTLEQDEVRSS